MTGGSAGRDTRLCSSSADGGPGSQRHRAWCVIAVRHLGRAGVERKPSSSLTLSEAAEQDGPRDQHEAMVLGEVLEDEADLAQA